VSDRKVIPFRKRRPSKSELAVYEQITRNWSPQMRQLMFPQYFSPQDAPAPRRVE
jgi:hypothetical protein